MDPRASTLRWRRPGAGRRAALREEIVAGNATQGGRPARSATLRRSLGRWAPGYLFVAPALVLTILLVLLPLWDSFWASLHAYSLISRAEPVFLGLQNYTETLQDPHFRETLQATVVFTVGAVTLEFFLGFAMALLLNRELRAQNIVRTLFLMPVFLTPVVVALMWVQLLNPRYGFVNAVLGTHTAWLADPALAMVAIIVVDVWQLTPFMFMMLFAGLQSMSQEPLDASSVDGATSWQTFWYITLPLLRPLILVAIIIRGMDAFREFDKIYFLTGGGPGNATEVISLATWRSAFSHFEIGRASAMAYTLLVIILLATFVFLKLLRDAQDGR